MAPGRLYHFFAEDHRRLEQLLEKATSPEEGYEMATYGEFRAGLLKHIKMEEHVLLPAAQKARGGKPLEIAERIRLDHGALTALMVPPPSRAIIGAVKAILEIHDRLEEGPGGMYETLEQLAEGQIDELLEKTKNVGDVPVHPHNEKPFILEATRRALARAGYNLDDYS